MDAPSHETFYADSYTYNNENIVGGLSYHTIR